MMSRRMALRGIAGAALLGVLGGTTAGVADEKKDKKPEKKTGTVTGKVTAKGPNFVEVQADGEEKARRYVPQWVGGAPANGGGPDKKMLKVIADLKVGDRVRLEWEFDERARVMKVEVLKEKK